LISWKSFFNPVFKYFFNSKTIFMRSTLLLFAALVCCLPLFAQEQPAKIICGNDVFSHFVREQYPELQQAFDATFESARQNAFEAAGERTPMTVNVVVHVVWKAAEENLADSIIQNQIKVLNDDFNRLNADAVNTRAIFKGVAASADITFKLAAVKRVQTTRDFSVNLLGGTAGLLTELKRTAQGGSDAQNPAQFINIWVCRIRPASVLGIPLAQILGFAFPPKDLSNWPQGASAPSAQDDGVVIDYRVFGANNPNTIDVPGGSGKLTVKGRTVVHEVGHYLGLRHIWGDGGLLGPNNCDQSDGINDTPFANAQSQFDCDFSKNTCPNVEDFYKADVPNMIENYMDYSSESCMNMFTKGQVALMRSVLSGPRGGLTGAVGTQTPVQRADWKIYPNPAGERAIIAFNLSEKSEVSVRVNSANGQTVRAEAPQLRADGAQQFELDTRTLPTGLYFVHLQTSRGLSVQKLYVNN
jgi:Pregnancy-associated plasma protein-A/Secretion system C-terminal sorting domain